MIAIVICVVVLCSVAIETMFCSYMKRKDDKKIQNLNNNKDSSNNSVETNSKRRSIKSRVFSVLNDLCFLNFKIVGYIPFHFVRIFLYRYVFRIDIGKNVIIYYGYETRNPWNIHIGNGTIVGDHCIMDARYGITIGSNCNISTGVWMWTLQHDVNSSVFSTYGQEGSIIIGDRAWISSRTTILPRINISNGAVVAAGAVVTRNVPPFSIVGGVPARIIGKRSNVLTYDFKGKHRHFL